MKRSVALVFFVLFELLAIFTCAVLVYSLIKPGLYINCNADGGSETCTRFGFFTYYEEKIFTEKAYNNEETTLMFKAIQASFALSTVFALISVFVAISGFISERFKLGASVFIFITAFLLFAFAALCGVQFYFAKYKDTFIYKNKALLPTLTAEGFKISLFQMFSIGMGFFFIFLGIIVKINTLRHGPSKEVKEEEVE